MLAAIDRHQGEPGPESFRSGGGSLLRRSATVSSVHFTHCSECHARLRATFFCQGCGQPYCSLDCYRRHTDAHTQTREGEESQAHASAAPSSGRLAPVG